MKEVHSMGKCLLKPSFVISDPKFEKKLALIVSIVRGMDGCLSVDILSETDQPRIFYFIVRWASQDAFDARLTPEYFKALAVFREIYLDDYELVLTRPISV